MFFYLAAAYSYLNFLNDRRGRFGGWVFDPKAWYGTALALFICALLGKTVTATLPAALLLLFWWQRGRMGRRAVLLLLPFFALGITAGILTGYIERTHVGAAGPERKSSPAQPILIAGRSTWFYAAMRLWPAHRRFAHPIWRLP